MSNVKPQDTNPDTTDSPVTLSSVIDATLKIFRNIILAIGIVVISVLLVNMILHFIFKFHLFTEHWYLVNFTKSWVIYNMDPKKMSMPQSMSSTMPSVMIPK